MPALPVARSPFFPAAGPSLKSALSAGPVIALIVLLWTPLVVTPDTLFPYFVGKALYARVVIEAMAVLWALALLLGARLGPPRSWVLLALAVWFVVGLISAAWGVSFTKSVWSTNLRMMGLWDLGHWVLLAVIAASVVRTPAAWRRLLSWNLGVILVLSVLALGQAYGFTPLPLVGPTCRVHATIGNPAYFASILAVAILIAAGLLARSLTRSGPSAGLLSPELAARVLWAVVLGLGMWALFLTGTRGALVGLAAGALAMPVAAAIWGNRDALKPVAVTAAGVLLAFGAFFTISQTVGLGSTERCRAQEAAVRLVETTPQERNLLARVLMAEAGFKAFLERPILGWGPENFEAAFDRHAPIEYFNFGDGFVDQAHNRIVEEATTRGALGLLSYGALWMALVWALVRLRRDRREEVLAYAMLGALAAYFVQNLFLFDTTVSMLQWALLIAWVAAQERMGDVILAEPLGPRGSERRSMLSSLLERTRSSAGQALRPAAARAAAAAAVIVLFGVSVHSLAYRPYQAAQLIGASFAAETGAALTLASESFDTFSSLSNVPRALFFRRVSVAWPTMAPDARQQALTLLHHETARGLEMEPMNYQMVLSAVYVLRETANSRQRLEGLDPLLAQLHRLAPNRVQTHQMMADHEYMKGNYALALQIAEEYEAGAPGAARHFADLKLAAQERLTAERE